MSSTYTEETNNCVEFMKHSIFLGTMSGNEEKTKNYLVPVSPQKQGMEIKWAIKTEWEKGLLVLEEFP
jgi:hypothetical protein